MATTGDILSHLEGRKSSSSRGERHSTAFMTGSPVLEGPTVTVAGAALLQRVAGAVTRVGGNILSSQVDLQGAQSKNGFVKVSVDCEVDQPSLQKLLYDLEAGMPLLFVDQLVAQAPETATSVVQGKNARIDFSFRAVARCKMILRLTNRALVLDHSFLRSNGDDLCFSGGRGSVDKDITSAAVEIGQAGPAAAAGTSDADTLGRQSGFGHTTVQIVDDA